MALKTYLYKASGVAAADLDPLLAVGANPVVGVVLNDSLTPITVDETDKDDLDDAMSSLNYEYVGEYTDPSPIVGRTDYGVRNSDPTGIVPSTGDYYFNSALQMEMKYDGFRAKWLSVEAETMHFGRDGNTAPGQFYRAADGRVMSSTLGWYAERSGTLISITYTRTDIDAATFNIVADGVSLATLVSSATKGRNIALNADFNFGQILAVLNQAGGNTTSNVIAKIRVKWRV